MEGKQQLIHFRALAPSESSRANEGTRRPRRNSSARGITKDSGGSAGRRAVEARGGNAREQRKPTVRKRSSSTGARKRVSGSKKAISSLSDNPIPSGGAGTGHLTVSDLRSLLLSGPGTVSEVGDGNRSGPGGAQEAASGVRNQMKHLPQPMHSETPYLHSSAAQSDMRPKLMSTTGMLLKPSGATPAMLHQHVASSGGVDGFFDVNGGVGNSSDGSGGGQHSNIDPMEELDLLLREQKRRKR